MKNHETKDEENGTRSRHSKCRCLAYLFPIGVVAILIGAGVWVLKGGGGLENSSKAPQEESAPSFEHGVTKSQGDKANYRSIQLANKLRVILISDPHTEKSAAALVVGAGFLNEPPELPGLAHYLEHFLFMSTKKYPVDNQLSQFLSKNGGFSNAYTTDGSTGYYFDTSPQSFNESLDRFSQFFSAPLLEETKMEGVLSAVSSEYENTISNDYWRTDQVIRTLTNSSHPYSGFHIGNKLMLSTLPKNRSIDVRSGMVKFFEKFYSTNLMTLAVLGKQNLDQLHLMVTEYFGPLKNKETPIPHWSTGPWGPDQLASQIDIARLVESNRIDLIFPIPDYTQHYKSKAPEYLSSVIGHEGPGSILSLLKTTKKWATGLSAGFEVPGKGFSFMRIQVYLTNEGWRGHVHDIVYHVFQYIEMLRRIGPQKSYWDTLKTISETRFTFKEHTDAVHVVKYLAESLQKYSAKEVWTAHYFYEDYKPKLITNLLEFLRPKNLLLVTLSKDNANWTTNKEPNYGVQYRNRKIDENIIQKWTNCGVEEKLKFPLDNEFLPTKFDLKPAESSKIKNIGWARISPKMILDDKMSRVWFLQDTEFGVPRASIYLTIFNPYCHESAGNKNLQNLLINFVRAMMEESTYAATEAGLHYQISSYNNGIQIHVQGYDHKIDVLLTEILGFLLNSTALLRENPDRFEIVKESYMKGFDNYKFHTPGSKSRDALYLLMNSQVMTSEELWRSAKNLTVNDVINFRNQLFTKMRLQWLIYGNLVEKEALALNRNFFKNFEKLRATSMTPSELSNLVRQRVRIPSGSSYLYQVDDETSTESCVRMYFQIEPRDVRKQRLLMMFLDQMLSIRCFDVLRTQEELGYSAGCFALEDHNGLPSFQVFVQGMYHPNYTESRIHHFLHFITPTVNNLTTLDFDRYKAAVETEIRATKPKSMDARANFMYAEMVKGTYDFGREHEDLKILTQITRQEVKTFFNTWINPASTERKILSVHVVSNKTTKMGPSTISGEHIKLNFTENVVDVVDWKKRLGYLPPPQPYINIPPWKS